MESQQCKEQLCRRSSLCGIIQWERVITSCAFSGATVTRKIGMVLNEVSDMDTPTLHVAQNNISTRKFTH